VNIVLGGVILAVYCFMVITAYIFISGPFEDVITSFENVNSTASDSYVGGGASTVRTVFDLVFAGMVLVPVIWFVYWVFSREPDWRYYQ
jgi:hypothetical protein